MLDIIISFLQNLNIRSELERLVVEKIWLEFQKLHISMLIFWQYCANFSNSAVNFLSNRWVFPFENIRSEDEWFVALRFKIVYKNIGVYRILRVLLRFSCRIPNQKGGYRLFWFFANIRSKFECWMSRKSNLSVISSISAYWCLQNTALKIQLSYSQSKMELKIIQIFCKYQIRIEMIGRQEYLVSLSKAEHISILVFSSYFTKFSISALGFLIKN